MVGRIGGPERTGETSPAWPFSPGRHRPADPAPSFAALLEASGPPAAGGQAGVFFRGHPSPPAWAGGPGPFWSSVSGRRPEAAPVLAPTVSRQPATGFFIGGRLVHSPSPATGKAPTEPLGRPPAPDPLAARLAATEPARTRPGPLPLEAYPRPPGDNGRGIHWVPTTRSSREVVDRFLKEAAAMGMKWVVFLNDGADIGQNDYLVEQIVAHGMMPVMRIYTPGVGPIPGDLGAMVRHYVQRGVRYFQIYNEPNLRAENFGQAPDVERYLDYWLPAAQVVAANGGLPGFGALAPGGDYDDLAFLRQALASIKRRGMVHVLDRAWISLHNYTLNHPPEYTRDSNGFLKFRWYDRIVREVLGRSLPIIGTEGGTYVGAHEDKTYPPVSEADQVRWVLDAYRYMRQAEPYFFAYTYWVIANEEGGGTDPAFRHQALFQPGGRVSPLVAALKALR